MTARAIASPLDTARAFAGELRSRSEEIEQCRTLPRDLVDSLTDAGMFRFWVPAEYGGSQVPVATGLDTFIELARHDAATGWCTFIANTTALLAAFMEPEQARAVFGPPDAITGGFAQPMGRGPGRGRRAVGDRTLAVGLGNSALHDGRRRRTHRRRRRRTDGAPRRAARRVRVLRPLRRRVLRHLAVVGLRGTGSCDYAVSDAVRAGGTLGGHGQPCPARRRRAVPLLVLRPARGRGRVHGDRYRRSRGRGVQSARRREDAPELQPCPGRTSERPGRRRARRSDGAERDRVPARRDGRSVGERDEWRRTVGRSATDDPPRQHRRHAALRRHRQPALPERRR